MYGMINRAIEDLVVSNAGQEKWSEIKRVAEIEVADFIDSVQYKDEVTLKLVEAASQVLDQTPEEILHAFGRHWILYTGKEGWASVFNLGGSNMIEYINGLDSMHARVQLAMPEARMPEFSVIERADLFELSYRSPRSGFAPMVLGLLDGLAEKFNEQWLVEHMPNLSETGNEIFYLRQIKARAA